VQAFNLEFSVAITNKLGRLVSGLASLEEAQEWTQKVTTGSKSLIYAILLPSSPKIIGVVGLNIHSRLLFYLHPTVWGQGYATEAVIGFEKLLFEKQPERSILVAGIPDGNTASGKILKKCGFVETRDSRSEHPVGRRLSSVESTGLKTAIRDLGLQVKSPIADEIAVEPSEFTWYKFEKPRETVVE
jgi:RimJ/RimL family protein N-acetyltransferase